MDLQEWISQYDFIAAVQGDKLITKAASILTIVFGDHEIFRSGGDEFVVLCPDITQQDLDGALNSCGL